jgi:hypothetical protein
MKITQDVRDYANQQATDGMKQKSKEFVDSGSEIYKKA